MTALQATTAADTGGEPQPRPARRLWPIVFLLGGLAVVGWLIAATGWSPVIGAMRSVGVVGLVTVLAVHAVAITLMGLAWWLLRRSGRLSVCIWGRMVREGGSEVLPLSQVGGLALAVGVLLRDGVSAATAIAATLIDAMNEFLAQLGYLVLGLVLGTLLAPAQRATWPLWLLLSLAVIAVVAALLPGSARLAHWVGGRLARHWWGGVLGRFATVPEAMRQILRRRDVLAVAFLLHLTAWVVSGVEAWLALRFMGLSLGLTSVLAIESLVYGTRCLGFMVPNALGIQEGAYVVLGVGLGLPPEFALGLSLLKRCRDLALGVPALLSWHLIETRRAMGAGAAAKPAPSELDTNTA